MKNIEVINFKQERFDTGVVVEDVKAIYVNIISGDEILTIFKKDGKIEQHDSQDYHYGRRGGDRDGEYAVYEDGLEEWCNRKHSDPLWYDDDDEVDREERMALEVARQLEDIFD